MNEKRYGVLYDTVYCIIKILYTVYIYGTVTGYLVWM